MGRNILFIGMGSFIGGVGRYLLSLLIQERIGSPFPFGTLAINIIGCFLIGIVFGLFERGIVSDQARLFLATGILGGFTTFSAFSNETVALLRLGQAATAFTYIAASICLGLAATYAGLMAPRLI